MVSPLKHYDILLRARRKLLDWGPRPDAGEQYTQQFPFGLTTIRATVVHLSDAEWDLREACPRRGPPPRP